MHRLKCIKIDVVVFEKIKSNFVCNFADWYCLAAAFMLLGFYAQKHKMLEPIWFLFSENKAANSRLDIV